MELSLKEFKEKFYDDLIEIHWRQWTALGVASHVKPEKKWIIDLEPLILSTLAIGLRDKRLLSCSVEWLIKNGEWMNLSRLKRNFTIFTEHVPGLKGPSLTPKIFELFVSIYEKASHKKIVLGRYDSYGSEEDVIKEYEKFFDAFKIRNVTTEPKLQQPPLIQLFLRSLFGVDARTEILIYLFANASGNSNSIAKEVYYSQRNVYSILEKWSRAQMVTKISEQIIPRYSINRKKELLYALGLKKIPNYLNWTRTFLLLDRLAKALSIPPWSEDEYLLSSLFRDLFKESKLIGKSFNLDIPEPVPYPGKGYFSPYASGILRLLKRLSRRG
jgi:hypothetical protein